MLTSNSQPVRLALRKPPSTPRTQTFVATFLYGAALAVAGCSGGADDASYETEASRGVETSTTVETSSSSSGLVATSSKRTLVAGRTTMLTLSRYGFLLSLAPQ